MKVIFDIFNYYELRARVAPCIVWLIALGLQAMAFNLCNTPMWPFNIEGLPIQALCIVVLVITIFIMSAMIARLGKVISDMVYYSRKHNCTIMPTTEYLLPSQSDKYIAKKECIKKWVQTKFSINLNSDVSVELINSIDHVVEQMRRDNREAKMVCNYVALYGLFRNLAAVCVLIALQQLFFSSFFNTPIIISNKTSMLVVLGSTLACGLMICQMKDYGKKYCNELFAEFIAKQEQ